MRRLSDREFERILIIKPSSFGDVIHALPVLNGLRHRYPKARISWLVSNSCAGLLEGHPALDEIILFDRKAYGHVGRSTAVTGDFVGFVNRLRAGGYDLAIDLQGLFRSGFLTLACGAPVRLGFASAREFGWIFYTDTVTTGPREMHAVERNYRFAERLGFAEVPVSFGIAVREDARARVAAMLRDEGLTPGDPYVLIGPGTRWETKIWPAPYFAEVAREVRARHGLTPVLIGMDSEVALADQVAGAGAINLAGRTSLSEVIALVEGAALVLMHDSGPMHLATAFNKPMVALYGPTSPLRTGPYGRRDAVMRLDLPCSPCYLKRVSECPNGHRCMRDMRPEQVLHRLEAVMRGTGG